MFEKGSDPLEARRFLGISWLAGEVQTPFQTEPSDLAYLESKETSTVIGSPFALANHYTITQSVTFVK